MAIAVAATMICHGAEPEALPSSAPKSKEDLLAIQKMMQKALPAAMASLVCIKGETSSGSGIVVKGDGTIYTAEHVVCGPDGNDLEMEAILPDGRNLPIGNLLKNSGHDAAVVRTKEESKGLAFSPVAEKEPVVGEWVFSLGHSNGYDPGRGPVVRLGRIISIRNGFYKTDCKLIGGDSGGGLFNLRGELIGIHSRVGMDADNNIHVPMPVYRAMEKAEGKKE